MNELFLEEETQCDLQVFFVRQCCVIVISMQNVLPGEKTQVFENSDFFNNLIIQCNVLKYYFY